MARLADQDPVVTAADLDEDVADLSYSLQDYYKRNAAEPPLQSAGLDGDLRAIFDDLAEMDERSVLDEKRQAGALIRSLERQLMSDVFRWTGHFPERTRRLVRELAKRADAIAQYYPASTEQHAIVAVTVLVTSLAMNHVHRGSYSAELPAGSQGDAEQ